MNRKKYGGFLGFLMILGFLLTVPRLHAANAGELIINDAAVNAASTQSAKVDSGDTAWVLVSSALIMLMTPGLAFFYGGLVRRKNILGVLMQCFAILSITGLHWVLIGYSLSFSPGNAFIGALSWAGLSGVGFEPYVPYSATIPHQAFMIFQAMFAAITPALIIGAFAERMKFSGFLIFVLMWTTFVYAPVAHWVWGIGGWLRDLGALDFAGGTVVHVNAGAAALVAAIMLGKRKGYQPVTPHNIPFTVLGAGLLWFGWFGFNAGSALSANGLAVNAFVVTNTAACAAGLAWALLEWIINEKPTTLGIATGAVAGLVAITPASGFVSVIPAIIIGLTASLLCFIAVVYVKPKLGYDDSLDAFGVHGIGGIWGAIATGIFAAVSVNPAGADGLLLGNPRLLLAQLIAVGATILYSVAATYVICKVVEKTVGLRVSEKEENIGLDLTQHHEGAYTILE